MLRNSLTLLACLVFAALFATVAATPSRANSPSFNCSGKLSPTETLICHDETLSELDHEMALTYRQRVDVNGADREGLVTEQRKWLRALPGRCGAASANANDSDATWSAVRCLRAAYADRLDELDSVDTSLVYTCKNDAMVLERRRLPSSDAKQTPPPDSRQWRPARVLINSFFRQADCSFPDGTSIRVKTRWLLDEVVDEVPKGICLQDNWSVWIDRREVVQDKYFDR